MHEAARPGLCALARTVHAAREGAAVAVQLTHAGSFSKPRLGGRPAQRLTSAGARVAVMGHSPG